MTDPAVSGDSRQRNTGQELQLKRNGELFKKLRQEEVAAYHSLIRACVMRYGPGLPNAVKDLMDEVRDLLCIEDEQAAAEEKASLLSPEVLAVIAYRARYEAPQSISSVSDVQDSCSSDDETEDDGKPPLRSLQWADVASGAETSMAGTPNPKRRKFTDDAASEPTKQRLQARVDSLKAQISASEALRSSVLDVPVSSAASPLPPGVLRRQLEDSKRHLAAVTERLNSHG
ncbi:hypothetical protein DIPPA_22745 [Diplonema papillatum]|nr:hypothetical protein DIPPA_22745 [Diplonema papillatum]